VEEIQPSLDRAVQPNGSDGSDRLLAAVAAVQAGEGPREILQSLLDQCANFCARGALFIVNEESVAGWQAVGFVDNNAISEFALDQNASLFQKVLATQSTASGDASQMDARFFAAFGGPLNGECHLIPILRKEKVAAVLYADAGGSDASCATSALGVLVRYTGLWLEVRASRTFAVASPSPSEAPTNASAGMAQPVVAAAEPSAEAPQIYAQTAVGSASSQAAFGATANGMGSASHAVVAPMSAPMAAPAPTPSAAPAPASSPVPMSEEEADLHRKAQRFAKLLIDEIRLYNKAKLEEGRKSRDIYDRLRDDIDKSSASYGKRYGNTSAASADYFTRELIRGLAQEDASLLGPNFQH
jgi:hypothetical protein